LRSPALSSAHLQATGDRKGRPYIDTVRLFAIYTIAPHFIEKTLAKRIAICYNYLRVAGKLPVYHADNPLA